MDSDNEESFELRSDAGHDRGDIDDVAPKGLTRSQALNLYVSHAFSTWNARGYEFAAVCPPIEAIMQFSINLPSDEILFTAAAYPDTLVAAALRQASFTFAIM